MSSTFEERPENTHSAQVVSEMLLFDIDGVITEPMTGEVEQEVVHAIVKILEKGEPVAWNTGRGLHWVLRDIFPHFKKCITKRSVLHNLCIVYQKGAFRITFNEAGEQERPVAAQDIILPPASLRAEVEKLIHTQYAASMFPGEGKEAVLSPQMKPGTVFATFQAEQTRLVSDLQAMLQRHRLDGQFRVDPTRIATDVEDKRLSKALGSRQVLTWLREQKREAQHFITFGDSLSDIRMAEEIFRQGFSVELVFVGGKEQLKDVYLPFPVSFTREHCEKGTVEYLKRKIQNS